MALDKWHQTCQLSLKLSFPKQQRTLKLPIPGLCQIILKVPNHWFNKLLLYCVIDLRKSKLNPKFVDKCLALVSTDTCRLSYAHRLALACQASVNEHLLSFIILVVLIISNLDNFNCAQQLSYIFLLIPSSVWIHLVEHVDQCDTLNFEVWKSFVFGGFSGFYLLHSWIFSFFALVKCQSEKVEAKTCHLRISQSLHAKSWELLRPSHFNPGNMPLQGDLDHLKPLFLLSITHLFVY